MSTLNDRLRELDRRVLREPQLRTPEGWRQAMARWRWSLGVSIFNAGVVALLAIVSDNPWVVVCMIPSVVFMAFNAGRMKAEHDRLNGDRSGFGRMRPPGL